MQKIMLAVVWFFILFTEDMPIDVYKSGANEANRVGMVVVFIGVFQLPFTVCMCAGINALVKNQLKQLHDELLQ